MTYDALVIGGGQSGLAAGYYLQRAGLRFRILEAGDAPVGSWPRYRAGLTLVSPARYAALPGLAFPGDPEHYPTRDAVIAYLCGYADHFQLPVQTHTQVESLSRDERGFVATSARGERYVARTVIAASGFFAHPYLPGLPGRERFGGRTLHTAEYRGPEPFAGQRVIVVGGGNAAVQIGVELADVAHVTLATRAPIRWLPQRLLGRDIHFWLRRLGLDELQWLGDRSVPAYVGAAQRAVLRRGRPDRRPLFARFCERGVVWPDGAAEPIDSVIFATGFRPQPAYLAGLGALDAGGRMLQRGGRSTAVAGLYYVGFPRQRTAASSTIRGAAADALVVVADIARAWRPGAADARRPLPAT